MREDRARPDVEVLEPTTRDVHIDGVQATADTMAQDLRRGPVARIFLDTVPELNSIVIASPYVKLHITRIELSEY